MSGDDGRASPVDALDPVDAVDAVPAPTRPPSCAIDAAPAPTPAQTSAQAILSVVAAFFSGITPADYAGVDRDIFAPSLLAMRGDDAPVSDDIAYWPHPTDRWVWDNRPGKPEVMDAEVIAREQRRKAAAEAEDRAALAGGDAGERLRGFGVTLIWLIAFTYEHNCWEWESWRVQRDIIRPATRARRCRYAQLAGMAPYVRPATVFMSHCWCSTWGGLVTAACAGARKDRVVWIDMFAVRARTRARAHAAGGTPRRSLRMCRVLRCSHLTPLTPVLFPPSPPTRLSLTARRSASGRATAPTWTSAA